MTYAVVKKSTYVTTLAAHDPVQGNNNVNSREAWSASSSLRQQPRGLQLLQRFRQQTQQFLDRLHLQSVLFHGAICSPQHAAAWQIKVYVPAHLQWCANGATNFSSTCTSMAYKGACPSPPAALFKWCNQLLCNMLQRGSAESKATIPPLGPIERQKWFFQISSQWESRKSSFIHHFRQNPVLPPCIWDLTFMSYRLRVQVPPQLQQCGDPASKNDVEPCGSGSATLFISVDLERS